MDLDPHKSVNPPPGVGQAKGKKSVRKTTGAEADPATSANGAVSEDFELHEVIRKSLESMPEVRRQLVETGRELAADKNYPSAEELDELGRMALREFVKERDLGEA